MAPSESPTMYPVASDEYDSYIESEYAVSGLSDDERSFIVSSVTAFAQNLSVFIESGLDNDEYIEYRDVEVNVTALNGVEMEQLMEYEDVEIAAVFWPYDNVTVLSYTNCSAVNCYYLIGESQVPFNKSSFELFVSEKLQYFFNSLLFGVDADSAISAVTFSV